MAEAFVEKLFKKYNDRLPAIQEQTARDQLIEFVAGHLRILNYTMKFSEQRSTIIKFFYRRRGQVDWFRYDDMQEIKDISDMTNTAIREAVHEINDRVNKETTGEVSELIESRKIGDKHNSPKEYRWAP